MKIIDDINTHFETMRGYTYKNVYVRFVQIQISRIVIYDLVKSGITRNHQQQSLCTCSPLPSKAYFAHH